MNRRDFIKTGALGAAAIALPGCAGNTKAQESKLGEMTLRTNPNTGDRVSLLGYGCMRWQMKDGVIDQESVNSLVDRALECGVNYFDTAPVYLQGQSEAATGLALSRHPRNSYYIATKLSNFDNWTLENSKLMYQKSFENLRTDYIDYYLLHSTGSYENFSKRFESTGMLDFLLEERKAGRIRNLGYSFHGAKEGFDDILATHEKYHWDFVQIQMNYVDWNHASRDANASYMYEELSKRGIPVVIMEPLLGGRLSKVPDAIADRMLSRDPSRSVASWAFRFCGTYPGVLTALSGMTYREHLEDNLKSFCPLKPLSEDDLAFLEATARLMKEYPTVDCTDCKYCMPCPYGIDIPAIFAHYNACVNEGSIVDPKDESLSRREFRKARKEYLISYAHEIAPERQADHCIHCGRCLPLCPQGIQIPSEMLRINRYLESLKTSLK